MRFRKLRIAWSVAWGLMVALLVVIWIRSYWFVDFIVIAKSHSLAWMQGFIFFDCEVLHNAPSPPFHSIGPVAAKFIWNPHGEGVLGIGGGRLIQIWLIVPFVIALAVMPSVRFRLRTLLIVVTFSACLLGLGRWSAMEYWRQHPPPDWH